MFAGEAYHWRLIIAGDSLGPFAWTCRSVQSCNLGVKQQVVSSKKPDGTSMTSFVMCDLRLTPTLLSLTMPISDHRVSITVRSTPYALSKSMIPIKVSLWIEIEMRDERREVEAKHGRRAFSGRTASRAPSGSGRLPDLDLPHPKGEVI